MASCDHREVAKNIDKLGLMRERDGVLAAPLLEWHWACVDCGHVISRHTAPDPDAPWDSDPVAHAFDRVRNALNVTRDWLKS